MPRRDRDPWDRLGKGVQNWWPGWGLWPEITEMQVLAMGPTGPLRCLLTTQIHCVYTCNGSVNWTLGDLYGTKVCVQYSLCSWDNAEFAPYLRSQNGQKHVYFTVQKGQKRVFLGLNRPENRLSEGQKWPKTMVFEGQKPWFLTISVGQRPMRTPKNATFAGCTVGGYGGSGA